MLTWRHVDTNRCIFPTVFFDSWISTHQIIFPCIQQKTFSGESDELKFNLEKLKPPCRVIFTLKKLKTVLPSLKSSVDKSLKSGVVYKITCPRCNSCYVGQTRRHLITRIKEHVRKNAPVSIHMTSCQHTLTMDDVTILKASSRSTRHLMTLEALFINQLKPRLNTKDEHRSRTLVIKFNFFFLLFFLFYSIITWGLKTLGH